MQPCIVIQLLLTLISFNVANIARLQNEDHGIGNHFVKLTSSNHLTKKNAESSSLNHKISAKIKRETTDTTNTTIIQYNIKTLPKCPSTLTYYRDYYNNEVCYLITEPTSFPPPCPYPTTLEYFDISWHIQVTNQHHWAFTHRNISELGQQNCFLKNGTDNGDVIPTSCSNKYPGVCAYPLDTNFRNREVSIPTFNDYCRKLHGKDCISDDFSTTPRCYCKHKGNLSRNKFCEKLVEIHEPYVNNLLRKILSGNETCWIGLEKDNGTYKWSSTKNNVHYTLWVGDLETKMYGALGKNGWISEEDGTLSCALCNMDAAYKRTTQVKLEIKKKSLNEVEVKIDNTLEVFQNVTCFSPNPKELQTIDLRYNSGPLFITNLKFSFTISGYYWCETLHVNLARVISNTIFVPKIYGREYALLIRSPENIAQRLYIPQTPAEIACAQFQVLEYVDVAVLTKTISYDKTTQTLEVLCRVHTNGNKFYSLTEEFHELSSNLRDFTEINIISFNNIDMCVSETTKSDERILQWSETLNGVTTIPQELCLQADGTPVTRKCAGDFERGSYWLDVNGTCSHNITYPSRTLLLNELLTSNTTTPSNLSVTLREVTQDPTEITSYEIYLISKSLEKLSDSREKLNLTDITRTISNVMNFRALELHDSQTILNSTDMILDSLDTILGRTQTPYQMEVSEKLVIQISNLKMINGIKLEDTENGFNHEKVIPAVQDPFLEELENNLELAMLIPKQLQSEILDCLGPESNPRLITSLFYDDVLFGQETYHPLGKVISITIPNFDCPFTTPLQVIFTSPDNNTFKCASWKYGLNDFMESVYGEWIIEGDPKAFGNTSTYQICEFQHVTHFTLLVMGDFNDISLANTKALDITTAIGGGLSILGLSMIFLTAIIFRSFRTASSVILLNFSIAITAKIVLLFLSDNLGHKNRTLCVFLGAALHYCVLSQFCWMLTIAIFQYKRYVVVYKKSFSNLVAKICLFSWGIPLIPVIIILLISRDNYGENSHGLCYALGNYFIFGVLVPVAIVIFINIIVFIIIILSITSKRPDAVHQKKDDTLVLQIKLAILLFFLLGLTWGFGLFVSLNGGVVFSYLFCATTTMQGFVLFLYFVVLNEKTRPLWTKSKLCCCKFGGKPNRDQTTRRDPRNPSQKNDNTNLTKKELLKWRDDDEEL